MAKHTRVDGDRALQEAKAKRAEEVEKLRTADPAFAEVIPADWLKRDTAFPPYLQMYVGCILRVVPTWRDERQIIETRNGDRVFVRYHLQLVAPEGIECRRGPTDERGEPVAVMAGQTFSIGAYSGLEQELNGLMGIEVGILCKKERPLKDDPNTGEPRKFYEFETFVSPETERMLLSESKEDQEKLRAAYRTARQLARENNVRLLMGPKTVPTNGQAEPVAATA